MVGTNAIAGSSSSTTNPGLYYSSNSGVTWTLSNIRGAFNSVYMVGTNAIASGSDGLYYYIDPSCFNEGTKILSLNENLEEEYIPIENLKKGDLVKSFKHGYRKIDSIGKGTLVNNPNNFSNCMYKMKKTEENGLLEDLIVTGWHAIMVDDLGEFKEENDKKFGSTTPTIDGKHLLLSSVSTDFVKVEDTNVYTYYHFILENNEDDDERFGVWANGILVETPSKNTYNKKSFLQV